MSAGFCMIQSKTQLACLVTADSGCENVGVRIRNSASPAEKMLQISGRKEAPVCLVLVGFPNVHR